MDSVLVKVRLDPNLDRVPRTQDPLPPSRSTAELEPTVASSPQAPTPRGTVRASLRASTLDGVFATIFHDIAGGVLLSNFLVELGAGAIAIGLLTSIPLMANLLQPLGAYFSERTTSRHKYCLWIFSISRLPWLLLLVGIAGASWGRLDPHQLVIWTLVILVLSYVPAALGSASWVSWMAILVPQQLRGRYFSLRNSAASLTKMLTVPLAGIAVAAWPGGTLQGYGVVLAVGILAGLASLGFQFMMKDVNPQEQLSEATPALASNHEPEQISRLPLEHQPSQPPSHPQATSPLMQVWQDQNFLLFLLYFSLWMFAANLSRPFLNLYMLDNLSIDVQWVTLYTGLMSGAHLLMLILWGKLADRIGNRPLLILVGLVTGLMPLLWLGTDMGSLSLWVWLPLLNLLMGGTWSALELCTANIQMEIAPTGQQSIYFAIAASVTGISGALGTTAGGFLAESIHFGGIPSLFVLSAVLRLIALLPLCFVQEQRSLSLRQLCQNLLPPKQTLLPASYGAKP